MKNTTGIIVCILLLLVGCAKTPSPTTEMAIASTETPLPPTNTPLPPTATPIPPTETSPPPTPVPRQPTKTPGPSLTPTPLPTSCAQVEETCMEVSFDGETCKYDGPTEFGKGRVILIFFNLSQGNASVNLLRHLPGHPHQDMLIIFGEDGVSTAQHPTWTVETGTWRTVLPGETQSWRGVLYAGIHTLVCARHVPFLVWYGAGLDVGE